MSQRSRLRGEDGFIREVVWIVVILTIISVVILDGMAIFNAYQSAGDEAANAAQAANTEYAQTTNVAAAKLVAAQYLSKKGLDFIKFSAQKTTEGAVTFTVTAKANTDTYAFRYLGRIPQLKDWVERTTHPVRTGSSE